APHENKRALQDVGAPLAGSSWGRRPQAATLRSLLLFQDRGLLFLVFQLERIIGQLLNRVGIRHAAGLRDQLAVFDLVGSLDLLFLVVNLDGYGELPVLGERGGRADQRFLIG